ncbi:SDR family oxidoreductase [Kosakonia cowanii]
MEIKNAVVVITGASSGIGEATARAAAQAGARVVLLARRKSRLDALAAECAGALAVACDVTREEEVKRAIDHTLATFGRIDVLVNNAEGLYAAIDEITATDFKALLDLNLVAPLMMMQAVIPAMRQQGAGSIINISSGATLAAWPGSAAYTSSKAALNMLSDVARLELADAGIAVSTLLPFMTRSEFYHAVKAGQQQATAQEAQSASFIHTPEQVAREILALIKSGAARGDLVPVEFGGSYRG